MPAVGRVGTTSWVDPDPVRGQNRAVDYDMEGTNAGAFLEVRYRGVEIPVVAGIRGMVGDVEKWLFSLGVIF